MLALIAFTGYGSVRASLASSPEFTTNGMLPKCWRRIDGEIKLYKGGTKGAANTGNEPFSEYYAAQVAEVLGISAISYGLSKWKGELCSTCALFTDKQHAFLPAGRIITSGGMSAVREYCKAAGDSYAAAFDDMLIFDALICNTDRHFGNFGFLVDNITNKIIAPAPLFDHSNSLFNFAGRDDLSSDAALAKFAKTRQPCLCEDFIGTAKTAVSARHHEGLRKLLVFRFKRHHRYNLPPERLKLIERQLQLRAAQLLEK